MSESEWVVVVDRVEGDTVVLVADGDQATHSVPISGFGFKCREGDVIRVPVSPDGQPDWWRAALDEGLKVERLERLQAQVDALKKRDPGGDVVM